MVKSLVPAASVTALVATLVATGIHHVFRLGVELLAPTGVAIVLAVALFVMQRRTGSRKLLWLHAGYTSLIVFWFGFLDGFLDHVAKSVGLDNLTFLPGGEADVVQTVMRLWSQEATTGFYEGTGILSAALALLTAVVTTIFVLRESSELREVASMR